MPEPMRVVSTGRNRSPSTPVGSRLRNTIRTGLSFVATMPGRGSEAVSTPYAWWPSIRMGRSRAGSGRRLRCVSGDVVAGDRRRSELHVAALQCRRQIAVELVAVLNQAIS